MTKLKINSCATSSNTLKANLLKPEVWDETINMAESMFDKTGPGTMVFGSALNLLLFSKTYKNRILNKLKDILQYDKRRTYAFAVSTSTLADEITRKTRIPEIKKI